MTSLQEQVARMICCPSGTCTARAETTVSCIVKCGATDFHNAAASIIALVQEYCAKVVEEMDRCEPNQYDNGSTEDGYRQAKTHILAAIRSRK